MGTQASIAMEESNKIITIVEIDSQQAQQEIVKLNATASNSTKSLEDRIAAKNKAIELQNQLAAKSIKVLQDNAKAIEGVVGKESEHQKALEKISAEQLKSIKTQETASSQLDKLNQAYTKQSSAYGKLTQDRLEAQKALKELIAAEGLGAKSVEEASKKFLLLDQRMKDADHTGRDFTKNVGNYPDGFKEVEEAVVSLRTQLREATQAQGLMSQKYGETSTEAIAAAQAVAELRDQIQFNADLVDSFNPDQKFKALGAATELAATGTSAVVSGMALFGSQSEDTEKALLKVQAAMAFSQAISSLSDIGDQYRLLKSTIVAAYTSMTTAKVVDATATEANIVAENQSTISKIKGAVVSGTLATATTILTGVQWLWNAAVLANPIVALVVALAAATAGIYFLTKSLMTSSDANDKASKDTEKLAKALDRESIALYKTGKSIREKNEHTLAMAKANGASSESIRKLEKKLIDEQIATDKASATTASNTFIQERNSLAKLKAAGASDGVIAAREKEVKAAYDTFKRENSQLDASYKERRKLVKDQEIQIATEKTEARKKSEEDSKKAAKDAEETTKKKAKDGADAKSKAEKEAKDALDLKKREAKAQIDLAETDIAKKKTEDPKADTLQAEKDVLKKKEELELMSTDLLESEKISIKAKYVESELVLETEKAASIKAIQDAAYAVDFEARTAQLEQDQALRDIDFESHTSTILEKNSYEMAKLQEKSAFELTNLKLTEAEKLKIKQDTDSQLKLMQAKADSANKASVDQQASDGIDALAESFGIAKEVAVAKMIMAAPEAIGNSFKNAAAAYVPPASIIMGALGAATTVVPIIKGLADIKKTRFPGKKSRGGSAGGGSSGASIASPSGSSGVASLAVGDLAANNAAQLGLDPSIKGAATSQAANNVLGSSGNTVVFSEGKYSDFKNQVQFKEQKTSI